MIFYLAMAMQQLPGAAFTCPLPIAVPQDLAATPQQELETRLVQATVIPPESMKKSHARIMSVIGTPLRTSNPGRESDVTRIVESEARWMVRTTTAQVKQEFFRSLLKSVRRSDLPRLVAFYEDPRTRLMGEQANRLKANPAAISESGSNEILRCVAAIENDSAFASVSRAGVAVMSSGIAEKLGDQLTQRITARMQAEKLRLSSSR